MKRLIKGDKCTIEMDQVYISYSQFINKIKQIFLVGNTGVTILQEGEKDGI